jgi:hypothetical protein
MLVPDFIGIGGQRADCLAQQLLGPQWQSSGTASGLGPLGRPLLSKEVPMSSHVQVCVEI